MERHEEYGGENSYEFKMKKVMTELKGKKLNRAGRDWDPTENVSRKGRAIISKLVRKDEISEEKAERIKPAHCHAPE